jgi:hypothetical protein
LGWKTDDVDWLNLDERYSEIALANLLNSNPVVNGQVQRATKYERIGTLKRNLQFAALNILVPTKIKYVRGVLPSSYRSQDIQRQMMDEISRSLILWHHDLVLHDPGPRPESLRVEEGQVWYLPSYHITRGTDVFDWHKKTREGKSDRRSEREFYSQDILKGRRPSIIVSLRPDNTILMVPCSHNWNDDSVLIEELGSNAVCHYEFRASWKMFPERDSPSAALCHKLGESELIEVKDQVNEWRSRISKRRRARFGS